MQKSNPFEYTEKEALIAGALQAQQTVVELSLKCEQVKQETEGLKEENDRLKDYIDSLISRQQYNR